MQIRKRKTRLYFVLASAFFCQSATAQPTLETTIQFHTEFFDVSIFDGLDKSLEAVFRRELDACAQSTDILEFRKNESKIPFFVAPDYQQLDDALDKRFAGKITFAEDGLIEDVVCDPTSNGNLFVSSDTISFCMVDHEFWTTAIEQGDFCPYVAHELVHVVQNELISHRPLIQGEDTLDRSGPVWLLEGIAVLYGNIARVGKEQMDLTVHLIRQEIPWNAPRLADMESYVNRVDYEEMQYLKGFVVANYLQNRSGTAALFEFYDCIREGSNWKQCFQDKFDLPIEELYSIPALR